MCVRALERMSLADPCHAQPKLAVAAGHEGNAFASHLMVLIALPPGIPSSDVITLILTLTVTLALILGPRAGGGTGAAGVVTGMDAALEEEREAARRGAALERRRWRKDEKDQLDELLPKATGRCAFKSGLGRS